LLLMLVSMVAAVLLAADLVLDRLAAWVAAIATGVWFVVLRPAFPLLRRGRQRRSNLTGAEPSGAAHRDQ
ncbi:MAG: DUF6328 family protein, partial [Natronosporangium sp.]